MEATSVVYDHPDELLGLEAGRGDHQAVDRRVLEGFRGRCHDRNITTVVALLQSTHALVRWLVCNQEAKGRQRIG